MKLQKPIPMCESKARGSVEKWTLCHVTQPRLTPHSYV